MKIKQIDYIEKVKPLVNTQFGESATFTVVTFGCQMNAKDSERLAGMLTAMGFKNIDDEQKADIVLFNTCTVRENANERLYGRVGQLKQSCINNKNKIIGICGCMMQEKDEVELIKKKYPFVKLIFGTYNIYELPSLIYALLSSHKKVISVYDKPVDIEENLPADRKYSFKCGINIMYGCNNFCSYCIVPYVRGRERSRRKEDILNEIKQVAKEGVVEVMLLGQNVNSYGNDLEGDNKITFPALLKKVCEIEGIKRVRFMTSHPKDFSDELIEVMKTEDKICRQVHLPVQSGSNEILKKMNRKYTREHYLSLIQKIKTDLPDVSISTDIIVGFPSETEEDFNDTLDLIEKSNFDNVFTFKYSKRTGTKAATMDGQVDEKVVDERFDRLLKLTRTLSSNNCDKYVGQTVEVLVEDIEQEKKLLVGRMSNNTLVYFEGDKSLIGKLINVKIDKSFGFYLTGRM